MKDMEGLGPSRHFGYKGHEVFMEPSTVNHHFLQLPEDCWAQLTNNQPRDLPEMVDTGGCGCASSEVSRYWDQHWTTNALARTQIDFQLQTEDPTVDRL